MTGWRHVVMRHVEPDGESWLGIHELWEPATWTEDPDVVGADLDSLRQMLLWMLDALDQPIMEFEAPRLRTGRLLRRTGLVSTSPQKCESCGGKGVLWR